MMLEITIPIRVNNPLNGGQRNWRAKAGIRKAQKSAVAMFLYAKQRPPLPAIVTLTRLGPNKRPMDSDGLQAAFKSIRDLIAQWYAVDDGPNGLFTWRYDQKRDPLYAVVILIESTQMEPDLPPTWGQMREVGS